MFFFGEVWISLILIVLIEKNRNNATVNQSTKNTTWITCYCITCIDWLTCAGEWWRLQVLGGVEATPSERLINCICYDTRRERLITGSNVIDVLPLTRTAAVHDDNTHVPSTHDQPLAVVGNNCHTPLYCASLLEAALSVCGLPIRPSVCP